MTGLDPEGDAARDAFLALLATAEKDGRTIAFWWRDDDAETVTPQLERLLELAERHDLPLGLAVVPKGATEALAARLARRAKGRGAAAWLAACEPQPDGGEKGGVRRQPFAGRDAVGA